MFLRVGGGWLRCLSRRLGGVSVSESESKKETDREEVGEGEEEIKDELQWQSKNWDFE